MGRKKIEEVKENEELKQETVTEVAENEDVVEEKVETIVEDMEIEKNTSEEKQDAEEMDKNPTVKEVFRDKYDEKIIYNIGDVFIEDETLLDNKPIEIEKGKYKVSKERYEELKRSLYVE